MRAGVCQTMSELNNGEGKERREERAFECLPTEEDASTSELIPHLLLNQRRSCHFANDMHNKVGPDEYHLPCDAEKEKRRPSLNVPLATMNVLFHVDECVTGKKLSPFIAVYGCIVKKVVQIENSTMTKINRLYCPR
jgi:hypothetical protein